MDACVLGLPVNERMSQKTIKCVNTGECVLGLPANGQMMTQKTFKCDGLKRKLGNVVSQEESLGLPSTKKHAKEVSNDETDDSSLSCGVSDLIDMIENACSSETTSSSCKPDDNLGGNDDEVVNSGGLTSDSSAISCSESGFCTSVPEPVCDAGVRKIKFKLRNKSEDYDSNLSISEGRVFSASRLDGLSLINSSGFTDDVQRVAKQVTFPTKHITLPKKRVGRSVKLKKPSTNLGTGLKNQTGLKRSDDLHRLLFLPGGIPDGEKLTYRVKGQIVLEGYKQGNGIMCEHCSQEISPSQFEAHAGLATRKKPYHNIYAANGRRLHDIALSLSENQTTMEKDERCTFCGDKEELIPCGRCPRAYHQSCVPTDEHWQCPDCDGIRSDEGDSSSRPTILMTLRRGVQKSESDSGGTCVLCSANDFSFATFDDRTVIICDQCEKEFHVGCLRDSGVSDLKELPIDKWFCSSDCNKIYVSITDLVAQGAELMPSSELNRINQKFMQKGLRKVAENDVQLRILSGKSCYPEHRPLLNKAVTLFRESFSPITSHLGHDLIPLMVHGRNIPGQDFGGMYCVLLTVRSIVVSAALLRVFGHELAELPLIATKQKFQEKGYFLALFSHIEKLLSSLKVKKLVLPAAEIAKAMWVHKLGFTETSQDTLSSFTRVFHLTEFSGTIMLEKQVGQHNSEVLVP